MSASKDPNRSEQKSINVLLCLEPRLVREMTRKALLTIPDIRIVGTCAAPDRVQQALEAEDVDWVIVDTNDPENPLLQDRFDFLMRNPEISLLAIAVDGALLKTWWLTLHEEVIQSPTLTDVVEVLHSRIRSESLPEKAVNHEP